jgi:hypothetical protein
MIEESTGMKVSEENTSEIRVSGSLEKHYAPNAKVILDKQAIAGQGFIAPADIATPQPTDYACLWCISANADADATTTTTTAVSVSGGRRSLSWSAMESASTAAAAATWIYWWLWYSSTATTKRWFRKILNF